MSIDRCDYLVFVGRGAEPGPRTPTERSTRRRPGAPAPRRVG